MTGEARDRFEYYLRSTGLSMPADAAQQYSVTLGRQWAAHLDDVLLNCLPDHPELRGTIIREFLYGIAPQAAEAGIRQLMASELKNAILETPPRYPG